MPEARFGSYFLTSSKGLQRPCILCRRYTVPKNIEIAVIRAYFERRIIRAVPLIEYFLNHKEPRTKVKSHRPLICFPTGIAFRPELHIQLSAHRAGHCVFGQLGRGSPAVLNSMP
jgi:hypothetical protein